MANKRAEDDERRANLTRTESLPSTQRASARDRIGRVAAPASESDARDAQDRDSGIYQESGETIVLDQDEVEIEHPATVVGDDEVQARMRGTWEMVWGNRTYNFEDGRRTKIPRDLFNYLKAHRNIYDH